VGINTTIGATSLRPKNGLNWQWDAGSNPALSSQKTIMFPYLERDGFFLPSYYPIICTFIGR